MNLLPVLKGFLLMIAAIVAIGPQNAFLLRQAVRREAAWLVAGIFLTGDVTMILLGGFGIGDVITNWPWLKFAFTLLGGLYILRFGIVTFRQMLKPKVLTMADMPRQNILKGALAVTFLNPHAIFDTVILVGTLSLQFQGIAKGQFMLGAMAASACWFFGVAWAGQKLAPFLSRPSVWRVIDGFIVAVMLTLSASLLIDAVGQAVILTKQN